MYTCSMSLGLLPRLFRRRRTAGKISALCLIGCEKTASASSLEPAAIATEPDLPDVSMANIKGSFAMVYLPGVTRFWRFFWESRILRRELLFVRLDFPILTAL
jgi:hypothetical protein